MTQFDKMRFTGATIVHYIVNDDYRFVARFKYGDKASFLSFLAKNFTVEEYFAELSAGTPPLKILESKGYVQPRLRKILKAAGYPQTVAGRDQYIADKIAAA
jgi:hypothetical protein